jgi:hypothetical protein
MGLTIPLGYLQGLQRDQQRMICCNGTGALWKRGYGRPMRDDCPVKRCLRDISLNMAVALLVHAERSLALGF